jgi:aminodeoxyfutalosine synthase
MFDDVIRRIALGHRLGIADCEALYEHDDFETVRALANDARRRRVGDFVRVCARREITFTTGCANSCLRCSRSEERRHFGLMVRPVDEVVRLASEAEAAGYGHIRLVGGANPELPYEYYIDLVHGLRALGDRLHIQAFAPAQLAQIAATGGVSLAEALSDLKAAGVDSLPGDGAEVFAPRVRQVVCPSKVSGGTWLTVMREGNECGIAGEATMTYSHLETTREKAEHLVRIRDLQDDTEGLLAYSPLPVANGSGENGGGHDLGDTLREISVGRLMLDNVAHIRYMWESAGVAGCRAALTAGADEVCITVSDLRDGGYPEEVSVAASVAAELGMTVRTPERYQCVANLETVGCG